jgi:hypothetical protein
MACQIHDPCNSSCYAASLHYMASLTTTASLQLVPQTDNILVGYEWASPLVPTSTPWYPFESELIQFPTSHLGQESSGTVPLHNPYHPEPRAYEREQKPAPPFRERVRTPTLHSFQAHTKIVCNSTAVSYTVHPGCYPNDHAQQSLRNASSSSSE